MNRYLMITSIMFTFLILLWYVNIGAVKTFDKSNYQYSLCHNKVLKLKEDGVINTANKDRSYYYIQPLIYKRSKSWIPFVYKRDTILKGPKIYHSK